MHSLLLSLTTNDQPGNALQVLCEWHDKAQFNKTNTNSRNSKNSKNGNSSNNSNNNGPTTMSFNILLQSCSDSCDTNTADQVLIKMKEMNIKPDQHSTDLVIDIFGNDEKCPASIHKDLTSKSKSVIKNNIGPVGSNQEDNCMYVNVRNNTVAQCRAILNEAIQKNCGIIETTGTTRTTTSMQDMVVITGFGNMHETSIQLLNELEIQYETGTKQKHIGRITVPSLELIQYGIRMENEIRNADIMRSSMVRFGIVACLVGLPLFGNPIFLAITSLQ